MRSFPFLQHIARDDHQINESGITHKRLFINFDLLILLSLLVIMNVPLLMDMSHIFGDTFSAYQEFSINYNEIYYHHQIPLWLPYSSYGIPGFSPISLSIVSYYFIGLGQLLRITDSLLLFKFSLLAEQMIAIGGMYLLARQLFQKKWVVMVVCLATMATFSVYRQVVLNFRMVYLLPVALFFINRFFERKRPELLWLSGITLLFSIPGSVFYPLIIEFYALAIYFVILLLQNPRIITCLYKINWKNILAFTAFLLLCGLILFCLENYYAGVLLIRGGRSANMAVTLGDFLSYSKSWTPIDLAISLIYGLVTPSITNNYEYIFYIGLLPLLGVIAACCYQRKPGWLAVLGAGLFLYLISLREIFAAIVYYLPLVNKTRYTAILGIIPFRLFLILAAGWGLDLDLKKKHLVKIGGVFITIILIIEGLGTLTAPSLTGAYNRFNDVLMNAVNYTRDYKLLLLRLVGYLLLILLFYIIKQITNTHDNIKPWLYRFFNLMLLVVVILDLAEFRYNYETKIQKFQPAPFQIPLSYRLIQPLAYQAERDINPPNEQISQVSQFASSLQPINAYDMESYVQFDRCIPYYVTHFNNKFEIISNSIAPFINADLTLVSSTVPTKALNQVFACGYPKLRVVSNVSVMDNSSDVLDAINHAVDLSNLLILSKEDTSIVSELNKPNPKADIQVVSFSMNRFVMEVNLQEKEGGWLIYSDANHPEWHASVNGVPVKIEKAYLAFKAIHLTSGKNLVDWEYGSWADQITMSILAWLCGIAGMVAVCCLLLLVFTSLKELY
jgi:hypothetical protein